jgi:predicted anti-sigma-YlaC factor YlaD
VNISCEIIKDLLPLYQDGVCSNESRQAVEEHFAECENCQNELQAIQAMLPINNTGRNLNEAESIMKLSQKWRLGKVKSFLKGTLITLFVIVVLALVLYLFIDIRLVVVP